MSMEIFFNSWNYIVLFFGIVFLVLLVLSIVAGLRIFKKAGQPQWAAIIPFYNTVVLLRIIRKSVWWVIPAWLPVILVFMPNTPSLIASMINLLSVVVAFYFIYHLAKAFGRGIGFAFGLFALSFIFFPILAFGKSQYIYGPNPN